jgi:aminoglycoside phosphotransferase (APT) family kinase protein
VAAHVSLQVPEPVGKGHATADYPFSWAVYRWIHGQPYADRLVDDEPRAAEDLAHFVTQLRQMGTTDAPNTGRAPLRELDARTRTAIDAAGDEIDAVAAAAAWSSALASPAWDGDPVWVHTDLLRPNLLVSRGRLCAVLDFGGVGVGDPAADAIAAWSVFGSAGRQVYREALEVGDGTWARARGYALHQAALIVPYYRDTSPRFADSAKRTIREVLDDRTSR